MIRTRRAENPGGWRRGQRHRRVEVRVWRMPAAEIAAHSPKADSFGYSPAVRLSRWREIDAGRLAGNWAMTRARAYVEYVELNPRDRGREPNRLLTCLI